MARPFRSLFSGELAGPRERPVLTHRASRRHVITRPITPSSPPQSPSRPGANVCLSAFSVLFICPLTFCCMLAEHSTSPDSAATSPPSPRGNPTPPKTNLPPLSMNPPPPPRPARPPRTLSSPPRLPLFPATPSPNSPRK